MRKLLCLFCLLLPLLAPAQAEDAALRQQLDSLSKEAMRLAGQRYFDQALEINERALHLARDSGGLLSAVYGDACWDRGVIFLQKGDYPAAEARFLESKEAYTAALGPYHRLTVLAADNLSDVYLRMRDFEKSEHYHLMVKEIREQTLGKHHKDYISALSNLANLYTEMGEFERAEPLYIETLSLREQTNGKDNRDYATALNNRGLNFLHAGRYEQAEPLLLEAFHIRERVLGAKHSHYASSLSNLGRLYTEKGDYEQAEPYLIQAMDARRTIFGEQHPAYSWSLNNLAQFYLATTAYNKAEPLLQEALKIKLQTLGNTHPDYAKSLLNLARLFTRKGLYDSAAPLLLEGLRIYTDKIDKHHPDYMSALHDLALLYLDTGKTVEADSVLTREKNAHEQIGDTLSPWYARCLQTLGESARLNKRWELAENQFAKASDIFRQSLGTTHPAQAALNRQRACLYHDMGQTARAVQYAAEAVAIEQALLIRATRYMSERNLATYATLLSPTQSLLYDMAASEPSWVGQCYDQVLFTKGFLLHSAAEISRLAASVPAASQKIEELRVLHRRMAAAYLRPVSERENIAKWEDHAESLEKELARTVAAYDQAVRKISWQEVRQALPPGAAAIEFIHYLIPESKDSIRYAALVLRSDHSRPHWVPLFEEKTLAALLAPQPERTKAESIRQLYASGRGTTLYNLIWQPLESSLEGISTIYYSVSGLLHRLQLEAIELPPSLRGAAHSEWICDRYRLHRLGSTRTIALPAPAPALLGGDALLYGGIEYEADTTPSVESASQVVERSTLADSASQGHGWSYLKWTEVETAAIAAILTDAGMRVTLRQGREATEESLKNAQAPRFLHIATHGYFFSDPRLEKPRSDENISVFQMSDQPFIRSGLIMAGGNGAWVRGSLRHSGTEDGILTSYEISSMNLSTTELAVLSACETGLGELRGYEGVYGLQRAFKLAGVRYILMSLWQVPDFQTQELMTAFYSNMADGQMSLPDAFFEARQVLRRKYPNPFYWAGFVLVE